MSKDYYNILGVNKSASKDEIKKAFHKMAHQYHPDKKGGDEKKFKEANEAYQVLSDDKKRAQYDQFGSDYASGFGGGGGQQRGGFGGFDFSGFQQGGGQDFDFGNLNDIFGDFFGGGFQGQQQQGGNRGRDISTEITITFSEAVFGVTRGIILNKASACNMCAGSGGKSGAKMKKCDTCRGQGKINVTQKSFFGTFNQVKLCDSCLGTGHTPEEKCTNCRGVGVLQKQEEIKVVIPVGMKNGEMVRLPGYGEAVRKGGTSGDLYIKIHVSKHTKFWREGNDLVMNLDLKLTDAMLGKDFDLETLDGVARASIPEGTTHGEVLRVKGRGAPNNRNKRGDILMKVNVVFPRKLSRKARETIEKLKEEGL